MPKRDNGLEATKAEPSAAEVQVLAAAIIARNAVMFKIFTVYFFFKA